MTSHTGGPSSSCEMIILRNNSHGGIIRVCMGIFTTALRNKKIRQILNKNTSPYFHSVSLVIWPLNLMNRAHLSELFISRFSRSQFIYYRSGRSGEKWSGQTDRPKFEGTWKDSRCHLLEWHCLPSLRSWPSLDCSLFLRSINGGATLAPTDRKVGREFSYSRQSKGSGCRYMGWGQYVKQENVWSCELSTPQTCNQWVKQDPALCW